MDPLIDSWTVAGCIQPSSELGFYRDSSSSSSSIGMTVTNSGTRLSAQTAGELMWNTIWVTDKPLVPGEPIRAACPQPREDWEQGHPLWCIR